MSIKKNFLEKLKTLLNSNNLEGLKSHLSNYSYYDLDDSEFYLVCLGYHRIKDFITSNTLIATKSKIIKDYKLKKKFIRLEIFNLFFLSRYDEAKIQINLAIKFSYDPEVIKIYYLICKNINDYNDFILKIKNNIDKNQPKLEESLVLIKFLKDNFEYGLLGRLLLRILKFHQNHNNEFITENIATNYFVQKKYILANKYYKKLSLINSKNDTLLLNLAIISNYQRQPKKCEKYLKKCLELNPNNLKALDFQVSLNLGNLSDKIITELNKKEAVLENDLNLEYLFFCLAKIYEFNKNYEKAYRYFSKANLIKNKSTNFDLNKITNESNFFLNYFGKNKDISSDKILNKNKIPIFIVGLPRSGTTLVEHILGAHPAVQHFGETNFFSKNFKFLFNVYNLDQNKDIFSNYKTEDYLNYGKLYLNYFNLRKDKNYFTDKMPFNFYYLGLIKRALPNSKIIITKRDYRDIGLSILKNNFALDVNFAYDKKNIIDFIRNYHETIKRWKVILENDLFEIDYENLINDPDINVRSLLKFVGLNYDPMCLSFYKKNLSSDTISTNQVTKNFYDNSVGSWKNFYDYSASFFDSLKDIK